MARQQKKKLKSINLWRKRIDFASEVWENAERRHGWHRFIDYFNNRYHEHIHVDIPVSTINKVYAFVKTAVASLYFRDPHITINAKQANGTKSAVIKEQAINYYWREKNIKRHMRKAIGEAKIVGFSYMKVGYDADIRSKTVAGEVIESVVSEDFWAIHIPHTNILYDTECVDPLHDSRWVIHWFLKPTKYLQERYPNLEIKSTADINKHHHAHRPGSRARLSKTDAEQTKVYEIWDKDSQTKYLMCDGCEKWLEEPIQAQEEGMIGPLKIEGFPIVMLRFSDIFDNTVDNFPVGEVEVWEEQLEEKIKLRSMQLNHIKRYSRQTWVAKGTLDQAMMDKYESGQDGAIIETNGDPLNKAWSPSYPPIQGDIYAIENKIDFDTDEITGQASSERGAPAQTKSRTLGEIQQIGLGSTNRRNEQIDVIESFAEEIARKLIQIMKQFFDIDKIVRITGEPPQAILEMLREEGAFDGKSIKFNRQQIQGEEDIDVKMGSTLPLNREGRLQAIQALIKFGPAIGLVPGTVASAVLGLTLVQEMELKDVEAAYKEDIKKLLAPKQPSPKEQLDLKKTATGIQNIQTDTQLKGKRIQKSDLDITDKKIKIGGSLISNQQALKNLEEPKTASKSK